VTELFNELKRRRVFRVAVVYVASAFVMLQGADIMRPRRPGTILRDRFPHNRRALQ
jgi:hypothetical protein